MDAKLIANLSTLPAAIVGIRVEMTQQTDDGVRRFGVRVTLPPGFLFQSTWDGRVGVSNIWNRTGLTKFQAENMKAPAAQGAASLMVSALTEEDPCQASFGAGLEWMPRIVMN